MGYREFTDSAGVSWQVWDTRPDRTVNVRAPYAAGWLSFECETERRRLQPIPEGWEEASDDAIGTWLGEAESIRRIQLPGEVEAAPAADTGDSTDTAPHSRKEALMESTRSAVRRARAVIDAINAVVERDRSDDRS